MEASSVPAATPNVEALFGTPSDSYLGGNTNLDVEKQQRKELVFARREEARQKAGGSPADVATPVSGPIASQQPQLTPQFQQVAAPQPAALRDDLIRGAVDFLTHPKVASSDNDKKRRFLQTKGLTNEEIVEAFKRSGAFWVGFVSLVSFWRNALKYAYFRFI